MPKIINKKKIVDNLTKETILKLCVNAIINSSSDEEEDNIVEQFLDTMLVCEAFRYFLPFQFGVPKSRNFVCDVLPNIDEVRFTEITRLKWHQFQYILDEIKEDPIFIGPHCSKQIPVEIQLIITLYRLGSSGEGASISKVAKFFGVGDGGTITKITKRVLYAIAKLQTKYLRWPTELERKEIVRQTSHELPCCVGYVDGTEIRLAEKPMKDAEAYFSRKQQYSLKVQITCDHKKKIIHLATGHPGSVHDSRIYANCRLNTAPDNYFSGKEWLAADSAYKLAKTVITPFKRNSQESTAEKRNSFNKKFSSYRVRVEHCIGLLKNRFSSLKELKIRILNDAQLKYAVQWIAVCCILHNIIIDKFEELDDYDCTGNVVSEGEYSEDGTEERSTNNDIGRQKRLELMELME